jgi:DNA-binding response OmpR family regulator
MEQAKRVLVVDDDETFCRFLAELLEANGMHVKWTTDGLLGFENSLYEHYDLFILDQRMPLILGTELVMELKKDNRNARIILTSAFADDALRKLARVLRVPLLSKPFSASSLLNTIAGELARSRA